MRISGEGPIEAWRTPINGSAAIAVFAGHAALFGSYDERDRLFTGQLASPGLIHIRRHRFVFEGVDRPVGPEDAGSRSAFRPHGWHTVVSVRHAGAVRRLTRTAGTA